MKKTFKVKEECQSCNGTGVYKGMAERDGFGVVCYTCKGTGCHVFEHTYEDFTERKPASGVKHVIQTNPGIVVGTGNSYKFTDFGGISYKDWNEGIPFPQGSEMRQFTCPAWWYQCTDYKLKPDWDSCLRFGSFSDCKNFKKKDECWDRFDKEHKLTER